MIYSINESCTCGAKFIYQETVKETYHRQINTEHQRFLDAHKDCRTKAIISNGKELKMFIANNTKEAEVIS